MDSINGLNGLNNIHLTGFETKRLHSSVNEALYGIFNQDKGVNKEIDEGVFQGKNGDCWLLSGVLSLSYTDSGKELIKDAIKENKDGSYDVYFKGIDKSYNVTQKELKNANKSAFLNGIGLSRSKYSTGDDDMLLIELALEKLVKEGEIPIETINGLTGGSAYYLYQLFTDNDVKYANKDENNSDEIKNILDYYKENSDTCAMTIGIEDGFKNLEDNHAYAVKEYKGDNLTLINPWDSTKEVNISAYDMLKNLNSYDVSLVDNSVKEDVSYLDEYYA